jgi:hypothetical protein
VSELLYSKRYVESTITQALLQETVSVQGKQWHKYMYHCTGVGILHTRAAAPDATLSPTIWWVALERQSGDCRSSKYSGHKSWGHIVEARGCQSRSCGQSSQKGVREVHDLMVAGCRTWRISPYIFSIEMKAVVGTLGEPRLLNPKM